MPSLNEWTSGSIYCYTFCCAQKNQLTWGEQVGGWKRSKTQNWRMSLSHDDATMAVASGRQVSRLLQSVWTLFWNENLQMMYEIRRKEVAESLQQIEQVLWR